MAVVFDKTKMLTEVEMHYCAGCSHGIVHRLVAECLEELDVGGKSIGVAPVGCAVFAYKYFNCDMHEAAHGSFSLDGKKIAFLKGGINGE